MTLKVEKGEKIVYEKKLKDLNLNLDLAWYELVYCILAGTKVRTKVVEKAYQQLIKNGIDKLHFSTIALEPKKAYKYIKKILKRSGYRFFSSKSKTIVNAATFYVTFKYHYELFKDLKLSQLREILVKNIKGIGYKTASHWLRNIGFDIPVIDVHVKNFLLENKMLPSKYKKNSLTPKSYLEIEKKILEITRNISINPSLFDFLIWSTRINLPRAGNSIIDKKAKGRVKMTKNKPLEEILKCPICGKRFVKESEHIWKPTCGCFRKEIRVCVG